MFVYAAPVDLKRCMFAHLPLLLNRRLLLDEEFLNFDSFFTHAYLRPFKPREYGTAILARRDNSVSKVSF